MARATAIGLVLLAALALLAAWQGPRHLDWSRYRDRIAALAGDALGREVRIAGPITLALLPRPRLTAEAVTITDAAGTPLTVRALSLDIGLHALLEGRITARLLSLDGAVLHVPATLPDAASLTRLPPPFGLVVRLDHSAIIIGDHRLDDLAATLAFGNAVGNIAATGSAVTGGRRISVRARLGAAGRDGIATLEFDLTEAGPDGITAALTGQLAGDGSFLGRVAASGADLSRLAPSPRLPFRAEGRVSLAGGLAAADDLSLLIGDAPARGAVALRFSPALRLDLALAASRLDLAAWLAALGAAPPPFPVGLDLSAEAAEFAGATLHRLRAAFDLDAAGVAVREANAELPGEATLALAGRITGGSFAGEAHLVAPAPGALLAWLGDAGIALARAVPANALGRLDIEGHVAAATRGQVVLDGLSGRLAGAPFSGRISLDLAPRAAITAALAFDRLELDPWLPGDFPPRPASDVALQISAATALLRGRVLDGFRLDAAAAEDGTLDIRRLEASAGGTHGRLAAQFAADGTITGGEAELSAADGAALAALWPPAAALTNLALADLGHGEAAVQAHFAGPPDALAATLEARIGELRLAAAPVLDLPRRALSGTLHLAHPDAAALVASSAMAAWLGAGPLALDLTGKLAPEAITLDQVTLSAGTRDLHGHLALALNGRLPRLTGSLTAGPLDLPEFDWRGAAPLRLGWLAGWNAALDFAASRLTPATGPALDDVTAHLALDAGTLRLDRLAATTAGGALTGDAAFDTEALPPALRLRFALSGATLSGSLLGPPLDLAAGRLDAAFDLRASGHSPAALLSSVAGTARVRVNNGRLEGIDLAGLVRALHEADRAGIDTALAGGETGFAALGLAYDIAGGVLTVTSGRLDGPDGSARLFGTIDLPDRALSLRLDLAPALPDPPRIGLLLSGPLAAPQKLPDLSGLAAWQARHAMP